MMTIDTVQLIPNWIQSPQDHVTGMYILNSIPISQ